MNIEIRQLLSTGYAEWTIMPSTFASQYPSAYESIMRDARAAVGGTAGYSGLVWEWRKADAE